MTRSLSRQDLPRRLSHLKREGKHRTTPSKQQNPHALSGSPWFLSCTAPDIVESRLTCLAHGRCAPFRKSNWNGDGGTGNGKFMVPTWMIMAPKHKATSLQLFSEEKLLHWRELLQLACGGNLSLNNLSEAIYPMVTAPATSF